ncbi:type II secretion system protein [Planctopirus limnophila DSM 3776]|uniref:Type II secretion system protein n=1 Tax=Planctopirus limnophila (strain ATCC 43296 / DSM 3776 / IFAM 1008 / Mu 290) TaxID=521674 RepID=D5SUE8_PLAL2|nr:type II secretion system F family protein [Planctopirus limnophila]ADG69201.1 type II secretion system protein [Planctopirus limnophila DSM 3776]
MSATPAVVISSAALRALNQELALLIRAGIPLEIGFQQLGRGSSSDLARLAERIGERLQQGQALDLAIASENTPEARLYATIVQLGIRSGRLPEMLESMAHLGDQMSAVREEFHRVAIYPTIVVVLTYLLICGLAIWFIPRWLLTLEMFRIQGGWIEVALRLIHDYASYWMPAIPILAMIVLWAAGRTSIVRAGLLETRASVWPGLQVVSGALSWLIGLPDAVRWVQWLHICGLLTKEGLPIEECLKSSNYLLGTGRMQQDSREALQAISAGISPEAALLRIRDLPPFVADAIEIGVRTNSLPVALELSTGVMFRQLQSRLEWLSGLIPLVLTLLIGGGCGVLYVVAVFGPLMVFWSGLSLQS